jgi:hypothetical protein
MHTNRRYKRRESNPVSYFSLAILSYSKGERMKYQDEPDQRQVWLRLGDEPGTLSAWVLIFSSIEWNYFFMGIPFTIIAIWPPLVAFYMAGGPEFWAPISQQMIFYTHNFSAFMIVILAHQLMRALMVIIFWRVKSPGYVKHGTAPFIHEITSTMEWIDDQHVVSWLIPGLQGIIILCRFPIYFVIRTGQLVYLIVSRRPWPKTHLEKCEFWYHYQQMAVTWLVRD